MTNTNSGTVSILSPATNAVIATIVVGGGPQEVVVHPDGSRVYVTGRDISAVSVLNPDAPATADADAVVASVPVGEFPVSVAVHPDGTRVYVLNHDSNTISVISLATNAVISTVEPPPGEQERKMWVMDSCSAGKGSSSRVWGQKKLCR
ncbi:MAG: YncE family protein [Deinococcus sp.]|nr:YncE family protein [Deinococcus sp.]